MRLYGGRLIATRVKQRITQAQELRDAIVIDTNPTGRYCRVKIQGSNTFVKAWYPENWESTPVFLKPGNAVRINMPGGNRSRIEVMGHGMLIPTAVAGGSVAPEAPTLQDTILTGCAIRATNPASMQVTIDPGTFRIDGLVYALAGLIMDRADVKMNRYDLLMDSIGGSVSFEAASATYYRYDTIQIGTSGIPSVIKGTNFSADGTIPDPPVTDADHVAIGFVLIPPNCTVITEYLINKLFTAPTPSNLDVQVEDDDLAPAETSTSIYVAIKNQYGNIMPNTNPGYHYTFDWTYGEGSLTYAGQTVNSPTPLSFYYAGYGSVGVTFTKEDPLPEEESYVLLSIAEELTGLTGFAQITVRIEEPAP